MIQMHEFERDVWQVKVEELIEEMEEKEMLSEEVQEKVDSLLEEGRYSKAGRIAVDNQSRRQTFAY